MGESFHHEGAASWARILVLLGNGVIAFGLNVVSLSANKRVGALNMTVAGASLLPSNSFRPVVPNAGPLQRM